MRLIKTILFLLFSIYMLNGQDPHFSNYTMAPMNLSPALTGMMEGNHRLTVNYREQWHSVMGNQSFKTINAAYDFRICDNSNFGDYWGIGVRALADRSGSKNFTVFNMGIDVAYSQSVGDLGHLGVGAELGLIRHQVDLAAFKFDSQFDGENYDSQLPNLEGFGDQDGYTFLDVSIGLLWYNKNKNLFGGLAFHHVNNPNYAFENNAGPFDAEVDMKITAHLSSLIFLGTSEQLGLLPRMIFHRQGNQWQFLGGVDTQIALADQRKNVLSIGAAVRLSGHDDNFGHADALVFSSRVDVYQYAFGVSYDLNISSLRKASGFRGGLELSIMTIIDPDSKCLKCPRYF